MSLSRESLHAQGRYVPALRSRIFYQSSTMLVMLPLLVQVALFAWFLAAHSRPLPPVLDIAFVPAIGLLAAVASHLETRRTLARLHAWVTGLSPDEVPGPRSDALILSLLRAPRRLIAVDVLLAVAATVPLGVMTLGIDPYLVEPILLIPACIAVMSAPPCLHRELWEIHRLVQYLPPPTRPSVLEGHMSTRFLLGGLLILLPLAAALFEIYRAAHSLLLAGGGSAIHVVPHTDPAAVILILAALGMLVLATWRIGQHTGLMLERISRSFEDAFRRQGRAELPEIGHSPILEVTELKSTAKTFGERIQEIRATQRKIIDGLETAQRVKTVFLANMSHDLKSPLNSVIGFSELLLRGIEGEMTAGQKEDVQIIHASGEELLTLINNILDSARLEAGKLELHPEWTPSAELISQVIRTGIQQIGTKKIEFDSEIQPGLPPVFVDPHRISQAIGNLISNAIKFMDEGKVTVRAYVHRTSDALPRRFVRIDVTDTGKGIRDEDRERIFEAFQQADRSYSRRTSGMGLGLTLTRRLVDLHDGKLTLASEVGKGSTFSISLPLEAP